MYNSIVFRIITECNHHQNLILEHFSSPQNETPHSLVVTPRLPSPNLWQALICFLFLWICLFWAFHIKWNASFIPKTKFHFSLEAVSKLCQAGTFDCATVGELLNISTTWLPPLERKDDSHGTPTQGCVRNEWDGICPMLSKDSQLSPMLFSMTQVMQVLWKTEVYT